MHLKNWKELNTLCSWYYISKTTIQSHVRPDTVDDKTVIVDMEKFVWDCDGVEAGALLILKVGIWDPHVTNTSLVQF